MLLDNLKAQRMRTFIHGVKKLGGSAFFGPVKKTQDWQPVDAGHIGMIVKDSKKIRKISKTNKKRKPS